MTKSLRQRFEEKYLPEPNTGCWLWMANQYAGGYGQMRIGNGTTGAHRISYQIHNGPIPDGMLVLHRCDVRSCVNPDHLFLGTHADNSADMIKKGRNRSPVGQEHGMSKLTTDDVKAIRKDKRTNTEIAVDYKVSKEMIGRIKRRENWSHIKGE